MQQTADQFGMKVVSFEKQVGFPVMYKGNRARQANGCSNKDSRKNLALAERLRLRGPCETHRDERHP